MPPSTETVGPASQATQRSPPKPGRPSRGPSQPSNAAVAAESDPCQLVEDASCVPANPSDDGLPPVRAGKGEAGWRQKKARKAAEAKRAKRQRETPEEAAQRREKDSKRHREQCELERKKNDEAENAALQASIRGFQEGLMKPLWILCICCAEGKPTAIKEREWDAEVLRPVLTDEKGDRTDLYVVEEARQQKGDKSMMTICDRCWRHLKALGQEDSTRNEHASRPLDRQSAQ